jgi:putative FmdB family regulatory protein
MPTYEYACKVCAHEWEFEQSIKDAPLTECPQCHNATARRQISRGTGFILKGSGWYSDLYASSSNKPPAKSEGASEGKGEGAKPSGETAASTTPATPASPPTSTPAAA